MKVSGTARSLAVVALARSITQLNELLRVAVVLQASGRYRVEVCGDHPDREMQANMAAKCLAAGVPFVVLEDSPEGRAPLFPWRRRVRNALVAGLIGWLRQPGNIRGKLAKRLLGWAGTDDQLEYALSVFDICWRNDQNDIARAESFLAAHQPALLLVGEDGIGGNGAMIALAKERGAAVLDIPYEYSTQAQLLRVIKPNHPDFVPMERVLARWFPDWILNRAGPVLTAFPPHMALAKEAHGLAPARPWTVHGGGADKLAVESQLMLDHYRREGLPERKLALIGALALDDLHRALQDDASGLSGLSRKGKREADQTAILCALPPDYVARSDGRCEFASYRALLDFWIETVTGFPDVKTIFQAHPGIGISDLDYIRARVPLSNVDIASLIAGCDLLVTSVSSIIRWGIAARKPVVNYDVYRFDYPDYVRAPGVQNISNGGDFRAAVSRLTADEVAYDAVLTELAAGAPRWGVVDGRAGARLLELADELTAGKRRTS